MSLAVLILLAGLMAYIRLAPSDLARWHIDLANRPAPIGLPSLDAVMQLPNGAYIDSTAPLAAWDAAVLATPRTPPALRAAPPRGASPISPAA